MLDGELAVHGGDDNVTVAQFDGAINHQRIAVENADIAYGIASHAKQECRLRMRDENGIQIDPLDEMIFGWRWKLGTYMRTGQRRIKGCWSTAPARSERFGCCTFIHV